MKKYSQHTIDFLFPIALFFVFTASSLLVLLLASNIYQHIVRDSQSSFEQGTTLTYITSKLRQNDVQGTEHIYITQFDGYDALAIEQEYNNQSYVTYIYEADGYLKEIFLQKGIVALAEHGTTIMNISDLIMAELANDLFQFTCISTDGSSDSIIISLHSERS